MKKFWAGLWTTLVVLASGGLLWAAYSHMFGLELDGKVKPIEVATLAFTIIIAIILQFYFLEAADNDRAEKDLLIKNANDTLGKLRECRDTFQRVYENREITPADQVAIQSQLRALNHSLDALGISLGKSRCSHLQEASAAVTQKVIGYKGILTGGDFPSQPYTAEIASEQQQAYRNIDVELQELIFSINRH
jgi:hypothetical protein